MDFIKKHKDYFKVIGISLFIFLFIFIIKGIYPFGDNSLVYSDMHEQVIPFYYYFKDAFSGTSSIFISFNSALGTNFLGTIFYYIFSPFTFLNLIVKRESLYLFASIIIALKTVVCNISALYMLKKFFKNLDNGLAVILSLLYGFSIYAVNYYVITAWIDCMYMLPLLIVGLKNLFDGKKPTLYIVSLVLLFGMNFYIGGMVVIFTFLISLFYLFAYKRKELGKNILSLGISTVLALGASLVIILPTLKQYLASSRNIAFLETLLNSKLGPVSDKMALFMFGPILFIGILLLLKDFKKHKKFLLFYIPSMILLLIPVIVEPVNKMLHFGSYYFFTYRFGFISVLFMIIGASYYLENIKVKESNSSTWKKAISVVLVIGTTAVVSFLVNFKYELFQKTIDSLSLSSSKLIVLILLLMFVVVMVASILVLVIEKGFTKYAVFMLVILSVIHITSYSYVFLGMNFVFEKNNSIYHDLQLIHDDKDMYGIYRYKDEADYILKNSSMVTGVGNMDSFNSLTNASVQDTLKAFGYTSFQNRTHSMGGTLFSDVLLGNKYLLNKGEEKEIYDFVKKYGNLFMYKLPYDISFGYMLNEDAPRKNGNTFTWQNEIYNSITKENGLFIIPEANYHNIEVDDNNYKVVDSDNYVEFNAHINQRSVVYLEILKGLNFMDNRKVYGNFDVYVDDVLVKKDYLEINDNGILKLGIFDKDINVKVVLKESCELESLNVGVLDMQKFETFIKDNKVNNDIKFNGNKINVKVTGEKGKMLFLPINYSEGYKVTNNGKDLEVVKVLDNFIGIPLNDGENNITLKYTVPGLKLGLVASIITIISVIALIVTNAYQKLLDIKVLQIVAKWIYLGLYVVVLLGIYILPMLAFVISFVKYIRI